MTETPSPLNLAILFPLGIALLLTLRLVYGRSVGTAYDALKVALTMAGWILILIGLTGLVFALISGFVILFVIVFLFVMVVFVGRCRTAERK